MIPVALGHYIRQSKHDCCLKLIIVHHCVDLKSVDLKSVLLNRYEKLSVHWETLQKHSSTFWNIRCVSRIRVEMFKCVEDHYQSVAMHSQRVENLLKRISMQFSFSLVFPDRVTYYCFTSFSTFVIDAEFFSHFWTKHFFKWKLFNNTTFRIIFNFLIREKARLFIDNLCTMNQ